uniref:Uncharacterized protein n=1 Tax=Glossina austeni TaxID=7395 RepID=A0A1A9VAM1_GLOAU
MSTTSCKSDITVCKSLAPEPSADPIAILEICLLSSAAKSSTRPEASNPGTEQSKAGVLQFNCFSTTAASFLSVSRVAITESSSKILPLASLSACNRLFSNCRNRKRNSPCNFNKSERFSSISGRSAFRT